MGKWYLDFSFWIQGYRTVQRAHCALCSANHKSQVLPLWHLYLMCSQRLTKDRHTQVQDTEFQLLENSTRSIDGGSVI